jgi:transcriptional regulator with XRE-family HTH domain
MPKAGLKLDSIGSYLRELREALGLSLSELTSRLKWDKSRLSRIENELVTPTLSDLEEIALAIRQDPVVVLLYCLRKRYSTLVLSGSEIGIVVDDLVANLKKSNTSQRSKTMRDLREDYRHLPGMASPPSDFVPDPMTRGPLLPADWEGDAWAREGANDSSYYLRAWNRHTGKCVSSRASRYEDARAALVDKIRKLQ